ncbi:MAG: PAS domain S-box protein [Gammaproteobacteria bacterium]|nr:PAS domain S-box protein [Gammaproteobacteria bacterium]
MISSPARASNLWLIGLLSLIGGLFVLDMRLLPVGFSIGAAYVLSIFISVLTQTSRMTALLALLSTFLLLIGVIKLLGSQTEAWIYISNRCLSIAGIWTFVSINTMMQRIRSANRVLINSLRQGKQGFIGINYQGAIIEINQAACQFYEYKNTELINNSITVLWGDQTHPQGLHFINSMFDDFAKLWLFEHRTKNKFVINVTLQILPITEATDSRNAKGKIVCYLLVTDQTAQFQQSILQHRQQLATLNILEDIRAAKRLAEAQRALFKTLFDTSPVAIVLFSKDGQILLANQQAFVLFGYTSDSMLGESINLLLPVSLRTRHKMFMEAFFLSPSVRKMGVGRDLYAVDAAGNDIPVEIALAPMVFDNKDAVLATITDISERKGLEGVIKRQIENLEASNRELIASNQALDEFVYVASHDLKAPLRAIQNLAGWIEEDDAKILSEGSKNNLKLLKSRILRLQNLLDSLLDYSRIGKKAVRYAVLDCDQLVDEIISSLPVPPAMVVKRTSNLPAVYSSAILFNMVIGNLISNAIKHHDKSAAAWVHIFATEDNEFVYFSIQDNGPGIKPEYHQRIFKIFQTLKRRDEVENTGVGLAIVKKTLDNIGGRITLDSSIDQGCTFRVQWPKHARNANAG